MPGAIDTPSVGLDDKNIFNRLIAETPLKRLGKLEEIAALAAFLASNEAPYITGAGIMIDGGASAQ